MKGFDKFLDTMTIIITAILTIFIVVTIGNWWISLHFLVFTPLIGLYVLASYENSIAEYRKSMEQYERSMEYDKEMLERARRQKQKTSYYDFKKRIEKIRSKQLREIRTEYIYSVLVVIIWNIVAFIIMTLSLI